MSEQVKIRSTTILCVRRDKKVVMAGDGQVTLGQEQQALEMRVLGDRRR